MLTRYTKYLYIPVLVLALQACHNERTQYIASMLEQSEQALADGQYALASNLCDALVNSTDSASMTWRDYCDATAIFATAYEHDANTESSFVSATQCAIRALNLEPDSAMNYFNTLAPDKAASINTVLLAVDGLRSDRSDFPDHEEPDSLVLDTLHHL